MSSRRVKIDPSSLSGKQLSSFSGPMRSIGDLVLNSKKDIKFHRSAENRAGAERYAKTNGLILGPDEDINGDGINDVVLYNNKGEPVLINGYGLSPSNTEMVKLKEKTLPHTLILLLLVSLREQ